jgi:hypothetical protein
MNINTIPDIIYNNGNIQHSGIDRKQSDNQVVNNIPEQTVDENQDKIHRK